jgi:16S rRNA processing protein RimM
MSIADVSAARNRSAQTQLRVGRLTKAHGLKGGIKLELFTDDPDRRFVPGATFSLQVPESSPWHGKQIELIELRWYNSHPVGFFKDVADRTAAESLIKAILWVDQDPDEVDEPDAWYDHQLVGLDVVRAGERVGVIDRLEHLPAQDLLVVKVEDREVLVPFVRAIVPEVDLAAGRVIVTPPEGLFEVLADEPRPTGSETDDGHEPDAETTATGSAEEPVAEPTEDDASGTRAD